jgi:hypothetical protein
MSPSDVHARVKRAQISQLLHGPAFQNRPNISAMEEFLFHSLKYVFPAERGELTACAWACLVRIGYCETGWFDKIDLPPDENI